MFATTERNFVSMAERRQLLPGPSSKRAADDAAPPLPFASAARLLGPRVRLGLGALAMRLGAASPAAASSSSSAPAAIDRRAGADLPRPLMFATGEEVGCTDRDVRWDGGGGEPTILLILPLVGDVISE